MNFIAPRPFMMGEFQYPLAKPLETICKTIPQGPRYRLKYLIMLYRAFFDEGVKQSGDLYCELFDAAGRAFQVQPIFIPVGFTPGENMGVLPSGFSPWGLDAVRPLNIDYPGGSSMRLDIRGFGAGGATLPDNISVLFYGMLGWQFLRRGRV